MILRELDWLELSSLGAVGAKGGCGSVGVGGVNTAPPSSSSSSSSSPQSLSSSVPWLEALTCARCLDVLREWECDSPALCCDRTTMMLSLEEGGGVLPPSRGAPNVLPSRFIVPHRRIADDYSADAARA